MNRRDFFVIVGGAVFGNLLEVKSGESSVIRTELFKIDIPNQNNRVYTREVALKAIEDFKSQKIMGCLGMPPDGHVQLSLASHLASNFVIQNNSLCCDILILDTPQGNVLRNFVDNVEFRTAGIGKIKVGENGEVVVHDFSLLSVNAIPKGQGA